MAFLIKNIVVLPKRIFNGSSTTLYKSLKHNISKNIIFYFHKIFRFKLTKNVKFDNPI
jgi:hypothetical protein